MARHNVYFELPSRELVKARAKFAIHENGKKLGTIEISKGALVYYPVNAQKSITKYWAQFDRSMKDSK